MFPAITVSRNFLFFLNCIFAVMERPMKKLILEWASRAERHGDQVYSIWRGETHEGEKVEVWVAKIITFDKKPESDSG